ncbi:MAG: hypothetical protein R3279_11785, partial [Putridiphycobacter sp.]|nr:hypothetical protein [Putridiphycobacter sp.]
MKVIFLGLSIVFSLTALSQVPSYVPVYGLKSYWPFSGNPNDASTNANHLTNHSAALTTDRFGNTNAAYSFNGTNQYLDQTSPSFTFGDTSDFTFSVWISKASTASGVAIMNGSTASGNFI